MRNTFPFIRNDRINDETILESAEYIILKQNIPINIHLMKCKDMVIIRSISYEIKLSTNNFYITEKYWFQSVDEIYRFIKNLLDNNNIFIKEILPNTMKIVLIINGETYEINLIHKQNTSGNFMTDSFKKNENIEKNNSDLSNQGNIFMKENSIYKEENKKILTNFPKINDSIVQMKIKNQGSENTINILSSSVNNINNIFYNEQWQENYNNINNNLFGVNSYQNQQNVNMDDINNINSINNINNINNIQFTNENNNYAQNYDENNDEELFRTQNNRIIFRNGIEKGIIRKYYEIKNVVDHIELKIKKKVRFYMIYKASEVGDRAKTFHEKCDYYGMTLVIIETTKGTRFGGFTTRSWDGKIMYKRDNNAFVFSIDKNKTYDIIGHDPAIACYFRYGPIFYGSQIRIYDMFFSKISTTCKKGLCYQTNEDYELNNGEESFVVKDIEIYAAEGVNI